MKGAAYPGASAPDQILVYGSAHEHRELVTAKASHYVAGAEDGGECVGDFADGAVAGLVAERVVDELERVEIDDEKGT